MALHVELKAGEKIIIGESLITNNDQRTRLTIEGQAPILREKDILTAETANSPAKMIYFTVQLMYLDNDITKHKDNYFRLVSEFIEAAPSLFPIVENINNKILTGELYKALKEAQQLILSEKERLDHAKLSSSPSLQSNQQENGSTP